VHRTLVLRPSQADNHHLASLAVTGVAD